MATQVANEYQVLEKMYKKRPGAYRFKVMRLVALGYLSVILPIVLILALVIGGAVLLGTGTLKIYHLDTYAKLAIPGVIIAGLMARALFVRIPRPEGHYLEGEQKDAVLAYFAEVNDKTGSLPIHDVVLTGEMNAAVQQIPRFGIVGPARNYLILGMPLLDLCPPEEVKAIVAHEFGHLSHAHGRMGAIVYRLNTTIARAADVIREKTKRGASSRSYKAFEWFYNRFGTVTFAMRRGQEYEADKVAASAAGSAAIASSLCRLGVVSPAIGEHWDRVWSEPRRKASNAEMHPYALMRDAVAGDYSETAAGEAVDADLAVATGYSDSHPSLTDRLAALEESPVKAFDFSSSALEAIFGRQGRERLLATFDAQWQESSAESWTGTRESFLRVEQERAELAAKRDDLDEAGLFRLADLEQNLDGVAASRATYTLLAQKFGDNPWAHFHHGRVHVADDFQAAEAALFRAVELDPELAGRVAPMLQYGYEQDGAPERFGERFGESMARYQEICDQADAERESVNVDDPLRALGLSDEARQSLAQALGRFDELRRVFLVEKPVEHFKDSPALLLGFDVNYGHGDVEVNIENWAQRIMGELQAEFSWLGNAFWVIAEKKSDWLRTFEQIDGAVVYTGSGKSPLTGFQKINRVMWIGVLVILLLLLGLAGFDALSN